MKSTTTLKRTMVSCFLIGWLMMGFSQVRPGAERLEYYLPMLEGKKIALCGNQSSLVQNTHLVDTLMAKNVNLVKLFCPEHGFRGKAEAGAHISSSNDAKSGLPIVSLYGKNKKPTEEQLQGIDIMLFDLQDVGCRFYTYISTLHYVMEAAAENDVEIIVLDRPNPNGYFVDGPVLQPDCQSFVGMHPVPIVYGMTIGEYALMINGEHWLKDEQECKLQIVKIENYNHNTRYALPVAPSPNLPTEESIYLYPSLCLFEGTNISVGRGTDSPFEIYGAPGLKNADYTFTPRSIKGVSANPPHLGKTCKGHNLHDFATSNLNDDNHFRLDYLLDAYKNYPDKEYFFSNPSFFDKLAGNKQLRKQIQAGMNEKDIRATWQKDLEDFKAKRKNYLLYE